MGKLYIKLNNLFKSGFPIFILIGAQILPGELNTQVDFYLFNFHLQIEYHTNEWIKILKNEK